MNRSVALPLKGERPLECTPCGVSMTRHQVAGSREQYFQCPSCNRWISSTYSEVLRADSKFRAAPNEQGVESARRFAEVKQRLETWLASIETQDPYRVLGVSPRDSTDSVRNRYRQLAMERHPDRGGSEAEMREINAAYDRISRPRRHVQVDGVSRSRVSSVCLPAEAK